MTKNERRYDVKCCDSCELYSRDCEDSCEKDFEEETQKSSSRNQRRKKRIRAKIREEEKAQECLKRCRAKGKQIPVNNAQKREMFKRAHEARKIINKFEKMKH